MATNDGRSETSRTDEVRAAVQFFTMALQLASTGYSATSAEQARLAIRIALGGVIKLVSDLYPDEPSFPIPLNELRFALIDLDHGAVAPFLKPTKVPNRPRTGLSEGVFRAIVAAAVTRLIKGKAVSRPDAAAVVAKMLSEMGCRHASGEKISPSQIAKWREKMMTERAAEDLAVARYELALEMTSGMEPLESVKFMLGWLADLSPANFPKKAPA